MMDRSLEAGIKRVFLPNIDNDSTRSMLDLSRQYPDRCFPMFGLHPCSVRPNWKEELDKMAEIIGDTPMWGIGETGTDLYWDKTYIKEQQDSLRYHAKLAIEYDLPLILHVRDSFEATFEVIDEVNEPSLKGIFHCFTGNLPQAERILQYGGFKIGIGGVVTFKNTHLRDTLLNLSPEHLVLETDSPYLSPTPYRGKRNEPAYIKRIAPIVAEVFDITLDELSAITEENVNALFQKAVYVKA